MLDSNAEMETDSDSFRVTEVANRHSHRDWHGPDSDSILQGHQGGTCQTVPVVSHHHASLLKIINKTGSLFRGLGALRHFLSLSLSLHFLLVQSACILLLDSVARFRPRT